MNMTQKANSTTYKISSEMIEIHLSADRFFQGSIQIIPTGISINAYKIEVSAAIAGIHAEKFKENICFRTSTSCVRSVKLKSTHPISTKKAV